MHVSFLSVLRVHANSDYQSTYFNADVFAPFLQPTVIDLVQLLGESETFECKRRVAKCLSVVIELAEYRVIPPQLYIKNN
jgi:hypothetical protein